MIIIYVVEMSIGGLSDETSHTTTVNGASKDLSESKRILKKQADVAQGRSLDDVY